MMNKLKLDFKKFGYTIKKNLFNNTDIKLLEKEFDRIVIQLKKSKENINARWGSPLTKHLESSDSMVFHTHNVQSYSSLMLQMIQNKNLLDSVESIIGENIVLHHTKLFYKPKKIGSAFPLHQDWSFFPTKKNTMIAAIIHLSDTNENMGCVRIIPKSHNLGLVKKSNGHNYINKIHNHYKLEEGLPIIANAGDTLFFHSCTLHGSMANISNKPRKTILMQFYAGDDDVIENNNHTNVQLVLRGWNEKATRELTNDVK